MDSSLQQDKTDMAKKREGKKTGKKVCKKTKAVTSTTLTSHPMFEVDEEFCTLLPPLMPEEYMALKGSIENEGLREALIIWTRKGRGKGILVDGHNRHKICTELGIKYRPSDIRKKSFKSREDVKLWIWENQEGRRNMTTFQRIEAALKLKDIIIEQAKKNQQAGGGGVYQKVGKPVHTNEILGEKAGVSDETIRKADAILAKVAQGKKGKGMKGRIRPKILDALRKGEVSINKIYNKYCVAKSPAQKSSLDLARRIEATFSTLEKQFAHVDSTDFYDKIIEWASAKKAGFVES